MTEPLSRSDLHSAVQPPVNAFGNHATTTVCPLSAARSCTLPSEPWRLKGGATSPTLRSAPRATPPRPKRASTPAKRSRITDPSADSVAGTVPRTKGTPRLQFMTAVTSGSVGKTAVGAIGLRRTDDAWVARIAGLADLAGAASVDPARAVV